MKQVYIYSMIYPSMNLNRLHSISLNEGITILFENLNMLNKQNIYNSIKSPDTIDIIHIIDNKLTVDLKGKIIRLKGIKINKSSWYINTIPSESDNYGVDIEILYNNSNHDIFNLLEYLYNYIH